MSAAIDNDQLKEKLYNRTVMSDDESCWLWLGALSSTGYGHIRVGEGTQKAHRVSYMVHIGPIPDGQHVLHTCDNPICVNPHHLFIGTNADNMADKKRKGRAQRGERVHFAKLTEDQVLAIHQRGDGEESHGEIASSYGVSRPAVTMILSGKKWPHIYAEVHKEKQA